VQSLPPQKSHDIQYKRGRRMPVGGPAQISMDCTPRMLLKAGKFMSDCRFMDDTFSPMKSTNT
jgi:hypothetical protein